jgi:hypothetical protein
MKRLPLWTSLIPLMLGIGGYYAWWSQQADALAAAVAPWVGAPLTVQGFPYRIELVAGQPLFTHEGEGNLTVAAARLIVNRGPAASPVLVGYLEQPRIALSAKGVPAASARIEATAGQSSWRWERGHVARLSVVLKDARIVSPLLPAPLSGPGIELHVRETPATADPASRSATPPAQVEVVVRGDAVRFGSGDPLRLTAQAELTATRPIRSRAAWDGGTAELRSLTLADKAGEVLKLSATALPSGDVAGTVETVCPRTLLSLFAGAAPRPEFRARRTIRFAYGGQPGRYRVDSAPDLSRVPVRSQAPPCPVLRR